jgi:hypothetical protein
VVKTARVHHPAVPVVHQIHRRCGQRPQPHGRGARATGTCAGGHKGILKSGGGGSRNGPHRRAPQHTGAGASPGQLVIWPPAVNAGQ